MDWFNQYSYVHASLTVFRENNGSDNSRSTHYFIWAFVSQYPLLNKLYLLYTIMNWIYYQMCYHSMLCRISPNLLVYYIISIYSHYALFPVTILMKCRRFILFVSKNRCPSIYLSTTANLLRRRFNHNYVCPSFIEETLNIVY
jgi:hypothetical protein